MNLVAGPVTIPRMQSGVFSMMHEFLFTFRLATSEDRCKAIDGHMQRNAARNLALAL